MTTPPVETGLDDSVTQAEQAIVDLVGRGLMPDPRDLTVWDLGCGEGDFSAGLHRLGASVIGSDLVVHDPRRHPGVTLIEGDFDAVARHLGGSLDAIDLVFMHHMSEHVSDLKLFLCDLSDRLRPGASLLLHHDNYFQPTGHHDHGLLALDAPNWQIAPQGVRCWERVERCAASETHRATLRESLPWLWSEASEATKDPDACSSCNYFRRSQPWAHLLYGQELVATFPEPWFRTQLNRLTPTQVMWDAQDAGFDIVGVERSWLQNAPPESLVLQHGKDTLVTFSLTLRLMKPDAADR